MRGTVAVRIERVSRLDSSGAVGDQPGRADQVPVQVFGGAGAVVDLRGRGGRGTVEVGVVGSIVEEEREAARSFPEEVVRCVACGAELAESVAVAGITDRACGAPGGATLARAPAAV